MSKRIYLSPSAQFRNLYAVGNTNEQAQCNRIAECAKTALLRCGFDVKKAPEGQSMNQSIKESNAWKSNLHICIHTNAYNGSTTGGTLVMVYSNAAENKKAGEAILSAVAPVSPGPDYALRVNSSLAELNSTSAVAVYVECEFHDSAEGANFIINNVKALGEAICKGICNYYGITYIQEINNNTDKLYRVQVGSFKDKINAENCLQKAKNAGFSATYIWEG